MVRLSINVTLFRVPLSAAEERLRRRLVRPAARQCSATLSAALSGRHVNFSEF